MDIVTHAIVGAMTGAVAGKPVAGAAIAVLPDIVLGVKRKVAPNVAYKFTHSFLALAVIGLFAFLTNGWWMFWCYFSHLFLDVPTHSGTFGTRLFYPFSDFQFNVQLEWEFFNVTWWFGLYLAVGWSTLCLLLMHAP